MSNLTQSVRRSISTRVLITAALIGGYVVLFALLLKPVGSGIIAAAILPIIVVGWFFGPIAGLTAGILSIPFNTLLLNLSGHPGWDAILREGGGPGHVMIVLAGTVVGVLHDRRQTFFDRLRDQSRAQQQQLVLLEVLNALSRDVLLTLETGPVLDTVARTAAQAVGATSAYVCDWNPDTNTSTVLAEYYSERAVEQETTSDVGITYQLGVEMSDYSTWLADPNGHHVTTIDDPKLHERERAHLKENGARSVLGVPLVAEGQSIGYIELWDSRRLRHFTEDEIGLVKAISRQVSVHIHNTNLHAALAESEARYRNLVERSPAAVVVHIRGKVVFVNQATVELIGAEGAEQLIGTSVLDYVHPDYRELVIQRIGQVQDTQEEVPLEPEQFVRFDGRVIDVEVKAIPTTFQGEPASQVVIIDTSERREAEAAELAQRALAEALRDAGAVLNSTLNLNEVLEQILDMIGRVIPYDAANVMLIDKGIAQISGRRGYVARGMDEAVLQLKYPIAETTNLREMAESQRPLIINDTTQYEGWILNAQTSWIRSHMGAPIILEDEVIGFLNLDSAEPNVFSTGGSEYLQAFVDQAAIAIENARLHERIHARARRLQLIADVSRQATANLELDDLLADAARLISETFGYYLTIILLVEGDWLSARAASLPTFYPLETKPRIRIGEQGVTGWVAAHGEPLIVPDVSKDDRYFYVPETDGTRSELAVPIRVRDLVIGVLDVESNELDAFSEADVVTLQTIADQLAVNIQNARLYQAIRRRQRYLETLRRVSQRAAVERDPARFVQTVVAALAEEFQYPVVSMMVGDDEQRQMRNIALAGSAAARVLPDREMYRQSYDSGIYGKVITQGTPYLVRDVTRDPYYIGPPGENLPGSQLAVPIRRRGKVIGVLGVTSLEADELDEFDLEAVAELADELSVSLENLELNAQIERNAAELEQRVAARTAELQAALDRLEELDYLKTKFVADVSHELRTPVSSIGIYLSLLDQADPARYGEYLETLKDQYQRLAGLVDHILDLSRLELSPQRIVLERVDLNLVCETVVKAYLPRTEIAGLRLIFEPSDSPAYVQGESNQLAQLVTNLLINAINYTPDGYIRLKTNHADDGQSVCLVVEDTGMGIEEDDFPHLFERFYRGRRTGESNIPGTGLGLAIVREIVELHQGTIAVKSAVGEGTRFRVLLPASERE